MALVDEVLDRYRLMSDRHELVLDRRVDSLVVVCDRDRIERSVDNIVSNAVKFSPRGGQISASVSEARLKASRQAVITIADHGRGIPEDERGTVLDQFRRGSNVSDVPGSVLGLWSVRQIVEQHGGSLEIASKVGEGSTVTMRLPLATPDGSASKRSGRGRPSAG